jgi:hypothetical protein
MQPDPPVLPDARATACLSGSKDGGNLSWQEANGGLSLRCG